MGSTASRIAIVCLLGLGLLLVAGASPGKDVRRLSSATGQEVVAGTYYCNGVVFDENMYEPYVSTYLDLSATSGIASDFSPYQDTLDVPGDLDALAALCEAHLAAVAGQIPALCAVAPIRSELSSSSNAGTSYSQLRFSCQGDRDDVIGVIGTLSRALLTIGQP